MEAMRRLTVIAPVVLLAACASAGQVVGGSPPAVSIRTVTPPPTATPAAVAGVAGVTGGASTAAPASAGTGGATASGGGAAQPGRYQVHLTTTSTLGGQPQGPQRDETDVLTVGAATAKAGGLEQTLTIATSDQHSITFVLLFAGGAVSLERSGSGDGEGLAPSPPVQLVPARLVAGQSWQSDFTGPNSSAGSWSGSVAGQKTMQVGTATVDVWELAENGSFQGSWQGNPYSGTVKITADWVPALDLFVAYDSTTDAQGSYHGAPITAHGTASFRLLSTNPD